MSLKKKTIGGLMWTISQQFSLRLITFGVSVILARLMTPAEFGLFGMISILIALGSNLMDSGLTSSLIRTPNAVQKDYSTVFVINLVGSVVIYTIVFFTAPAVASFYNQEILIDIIRVFCIVFIINAFNGVQKAKLTKEMNFKSQMIIQIPSVVVGGILGITLAYNGFGVWSLVWMYLLQSFLSAVQHWIYSGWRPDLMFDKETFLYHFNFGYKMTLSGIIATLYKNIYTVIIAKYFSASQLGFYTRALSLREMPISNLYNALVRVTYPMFSSINDDDAKLKVVYKKVMEQVVFWIAPFLTFLMVVAEPFIRLLLTEKWLPAVPYFQILCVAGLWSPLQAFNNNIVKVKGKSNLSLRIRIIKTSLGTIGVFAAIPFGIYGLLYFQVISSMFDYYLDAHYGGNMINYSMWEQIKDMAPSISIAIFTGFMTWMLDIYLLKSFSMPDLLRLLICGLFYGMFYLGSCQLFKLPATRELRQLIFKKNVSGK